jgi:hypothetical protein
MEISEKTHGVIDLIYSAAFLAAPFILNAATNNRNGKERSGKALLPVLGAGILAQTLLTKYPFGVVKALPMRDHVKLDYGLGALMMAAPWILNMDNRVKIPLTLLGAASLGIALLTHENDHYLNEGVDVDEALDEAFGVAEEIA